VYSRPFLTSYSSDIASHSSSEPGAAAVTALYSTFSGCAEFILRSTACDAPLKKTRLDSSIDVGRSSTKREFVFSQLCFD